MGLFTSINIASTGLTAQRLRQDVISNNIANVNSTRTPEGGPFKRSSVIFESIVTKPYWRSPYLPRALDNGGGAGVQVTEIRPDSDTELRLKYDPTHPDAIAEGPKEGYVEYPNVDVVSEMTDLIEAERAYQANIEIINGAKNMFSMAMEIGQ